MIESVVPGVSVTGLPPTAGSKVAEGREVPASYSPPLLSVIGALPNGPVVRFCPTATRLPPVTLKFVPAVKVFVPGERRVAPPATLNATGLPPSLMGLAESRLSPHRRSIRRRW